MSGGDSGGDEAAQAAEEATALKLTELQAIGVELLATMAKLLESAVLVTVALTQPKVTEEEQLESKVMLTMVWLRWWR